MRTLLTRLLAALTPLVLTLAVAEQAHAYQWLGASCLKTALAAGCDSEDNDRADYRRDHDLYTFGEWTAYARMDDNRLFLEGYFWRFDGSKAWVCGRGTRFSGVYVGDAIERWSTSPCSVMVMPPL